MVNQITIGVMLTIYAAKMELTMSEVIRDFIKGLNTYE